LKKTEGRKSRETALFGYETGLIYLNEIKYFLCTVNFPRMGKADTYIVYSIQVLKYSPDMGYSLIDPVPHQ
jgi:hypothetical protein